jgi:hypothetical protein
MKEANEKLLPLRSLHQHLHLTSFGLLLHDHTLLHKVVLSEIILLFWR